MKGLDISPTTVYPPSDFRTVPFSF